MAVAACIFGSTAFAAPTDIDGPATPVQSTDGQRLESAQRQRPSPRVIGESKAVIISDSAMAGVRWNGALDGFRGFTADARLESCRRLVAMSCNGREGRRPLTALSEINTLSAPGPTDVLVIATGYNDWSGRFAADLRMILDTARAKGFTTIAWVNYRDEVSYRLPSDDGRTSNYGLMNAELDRVAASGAYPELLVWDFDTYTERSVGWFARDGVHELRLGSWGVADWMSRHMAGLDRKACPMPYVLGQQEPLVCPNPDLLPFTLGYPDLVTLYDL